MFQRKFCISFVFNQVSLWRLEITKEPSLSSCLYSLVLIVLVCFSRLIRAQLVRIHLQYARTRFNPSVGKILWRRERLPTPVFWPGEFHGLYSPWGHRVGRDWATFTFTLILQKALKWRQMWKSKPLKMELKKLFQVGK